MKKLLFRELPVPDYISRILIPLFIGFLGLLFGLATAPDELRNAWSAICTITGLTFGWVLEDVRFHLYNRGQLTSSLAKIEDRLEKFSMYFAFRTDNRTLEDLLEESDKLKTRARWLFPMFISKKLSHELKSRKYAKFNIEPTDFSEMLKDLLPWCSQSIFMTCPFTPLQWFTDLLTADKLEKAKTNSLEEDHLPAHLRQLIQMRGVHKKRFVIIPENKLSEFFHQDNVSLLESFIKFSNSKYKIDTRFAYQPILCNGCSKCDLYSKDVQIWDNNVVVQFDFDVNPQECLILLNPDPHYIDFFQKCFESKSTYDLEEMKEIVIKIKSGSNSTLSRWNYTI